MNVSDIACCGCKSEISIHLDFECAAAVYDGHAATAVDVGVIGTRHTAGDIHVSARLDKRVSDVLRGMTPANIQGSLFPHHNEPARRTSVDSGLHGVRDLQESTADVDAPGDIHERFIVCHRRPPSR